MEGVDEGATLSDMTSRLSSGDQQKIEEVSSLV